MLGGILITETSVKRMIFYDLTKRKIVAKLLLSDGLRMEKDVRGKEIKYNKNKGTVASSALRYSVN